MGRADRTILQQMNSQWRHSDLKFWSVFRPPRYYIEALVKNCARFWAPRRSHGPPSPEALTAGRVQRLAQSSRLGVGAAANPFCGIHGLRIVGPRLPADCRKYAVDGPF